ncbi:hypothetical protein M422DRAFT_234102 [Sphaerobolus stellatus SS14]|uniref:EKC/KEOPS complex subunit CGI121 n=1 Tax=Sphaerobolus stellatus (strain SS14) TaxID=990650 RepID=A0A0C9TQC1_SPHS4|nr:hypothetical protein M422DRAFT_234102 [Sphaerobolus stellatus SS14]
METLVYSHVSPDVSTIHLALYTDVNNADQIRKRLVAASTLPGEEGEREREAVNYAFVDAKLITSRLHILTAVYQAILASMTGSLRTKTLHSEILWALNHGHNISEAIKRFGVSDTTRTLLVIRVCSPSFTAEEFSAMIPSIVKGTPVPLSDLIHYTDWTSVRKYYKLNTDPALAPFSRKSSTESPSLAEQKVIDQLVTSLVAMKSVSA